MLMNCKSTQTVNVMWVGVRHKNCDTVVRVPMTQGPHLSLSD